MVEPSQPQRVVVPSQNESLIDSLPHEARVQYIESVFAKAEALLERHSNQEALEELVPTVAVISRLTPPRIVSIGRVHNLIGIAQFGLGNWREAELSFAQGLKGSRVSEGQSSRELVIVRASLYADLAGVYFKRKEFSMAMTVINRALAEQEGSPVISSGGLRTLWYLKQILHDEYQEYPQAISAAENLERLYENLSTTPMRIDSLHHCASLYMRQRNPASAVDAVTRALSLARKIELSKGAIFQIHRSVILALCSDLRLKDADEQARQLMSDTEGAIDLKTALVVAPRTAVSLRLAEQGEMEKARRELTKMIDHPSDGAERAEQAAGVLRLVFDTAKDRHLSNITDIVVRLNDVIPN